MNDEPLIDFRSEFTKLAEAFERIAGGVRNNRDDTTTGESFDWIIDSRSELLERKSLADILAEYRKAVTMAGSLCVTAYATELLGDVDGLPELIAAMELREWRGLVHSHANLFALLVGGPAIELESSEGRVSLMEKLNSGWPIQYRPSPLRGSLQKPAELFRQALGRSLPPDGEQCARYAEFCRSLCEKCPHPSQSEEKSEASKPTGGKPRPAATVNERMAGTIMENHEAMGWNSRQWAEYLQCAPSTVVETATWKKLESARQQMKAERMKDRRRKPKASDSRRD